MSHYGFALRIVLLCALLQIALCRHQLIVVSCDGFRYDYLNWYPNETRFLRQLIPKGVHVERMKPAFATKTFPNHWTIATGLYQESHGIISNSMYDPVLNATFNKGSRGEEWWNASLPIWIAAKQQGLKSATFFWPGSEVKFNGVHQDYYFDYNGSIEFDYRVKTVLNWITEKNVDMATMYLHEPDSSGHKFGPYSAEVRKALQKVDDTIRSLFDGLEKKNFSDKVDVLIVSDHGMMGVQSDKVINLNDTLDKYVDRFLDSGALLGVNAKPGMKQKLVNYLNNQVQQNNLKMRVFTKESLPTKYHYGNNRRTPEVLVLPNQDYVVVTNKDKALSKGTHGFDNEYSNMRVPMFAVGPSFKKNVKLTGFQQVDIYGLMCHLLEIQPQPNNGSLNQLPLMLNSVISIQNKNWLHKIGLLFLYNVAKKFLTKLLGN